MAFAYFPFPTEATRGAMSDPLDAARIAALCPTFEIEVHARLDSTQERARGRLREGRREPAAVFADSQSAGRGQHGRVWQSPPGAGLYCTVLWPSARPLLAQVGASLVAGLAVRAALTGFGVDARLKWPNDVWLRGRKLGGILIEALGTDAGSTLLVGIGLNVALPAGTVIDQPWVDLAALGPPPPRALLAGALLRRLHEHLTRFEHSGFAGFEEEWAAADALAGRPVRLRGAGGDETGQALGVDALGRLRILQDGRVLVYAAGEASIRETDDV
ncbi:MAG: Bifunctional ligase/repressor BirA [Xanthomonadales bacterium]|nr:Bifunctional ligase/repressor BirA [Xanthomonadales bacterium]